MSSTRRGAERRPLDSYRTPDALAQALVNTLPRRPGMRWLEPHVGGGAFVRALRADLRRRGEVILGIDIDPEAPGLKLVDHGKACDFLNVRSMAADAPVDGIIGNPPYTNAEAHVRHALALVRDGGLVAFLLRLAFLESAERRPFWEEHRPERVVVLQERPSFTGGGTDSSAYMFATWRAGERPDHARLEWLSWKGAAQPDLAEVK